MTVESPPITALIVELARTERVDAEQQHRRGREYDPDDEARPEAPAPPQQEHDRSDQEHVDRLRKCRQPEQDGGRDIASETREEPRAPRQHDLFVKPEEIRVK